jgi:hypothetical protein
MFCVKLLMSSSSAIYYVDLVIFDKGKNMNKTWVL